MKYFYVCQSNPQSLRCPSMLCSTSSDNMHQCRLRVEVFVHILRLPIFAENCVLSWWRGAVCLNSPLPGLQD